MIRIASENQKEKGRVDLTVECTLTSSFLQIQIAVVADADLAACAQSDRQSIQTESTDSIHKHSNSNSMKRSDRMNRCRSIADRTSCRCSNQSCCCWIAPSLLNIVSELVDEIEEEDKAHCCAGLIRISIDRMKVYRDGKRKRSSQDQQLTTDAVDVAADCCCCCCRRTKIDRWKIAAVLADPVVLVDGQ